MSFLRRLDRSGTSLIEVLVTFVIFLVGIVSVLRLFPGGFLSMRHTEDTTLANRLSQTEIERWQGKTANLPSGILPWGKVTGSEPVNMVLTDVDPTNLEDPLFPGGGYYFSDVNKFRRVIGESTQIPMPLPDNTASIYVLSFSPIAWFNAAPNLDPITVYGGELIRRPLPSNPDAIRFAQYSEYAIDYGKAQLYVKPFATDRWFVITYSYWQESGGKMVLYPAVGVPVFVLAAKPQQMDAGYQIVDIPAPGGGLVSAVPNFNGIDEGSDSLSRQFERVGSWSADDPYEFMVKDVVGGVIVFNPLGYGYQEITARGKEPLTAHIDYTVLDWHIIREERKLPDTFKSAADQDVKLTLRFIKKAGETMEQDGSTYAGLASEPPYSAAGSPLIPYNVLAVDVETGAVYHEQQPGDPLIFIVNYKEGILRFDPNYVIGSPKPSPYAGKAFRIYYRAEGDWALQPYKAYDIYRRSETASLGYQQYYLYVDSTVTVNLIKVLIYFPRCYAGCAVSVDYSYRLTDNGPLQFVTGEVYQISEGTDTTGLCFIDVGKQLAIPGPNADFEFRPAKVYGVSIGTRVIWHETGRRLTVGAWRKVDLQTYLTRVSE